MKVEEIFVGRVYRGVGNKTRRVLAITGAGLLYRDDTQLRKTAKVKDFAAWAEVDVMPKPTGMASSSPAGGVGA